jgi:uroporphyrinogen-III synthase
LAVKTILVSQPKPEGDKSPYFDLAEKYKLKIDFRPFVQVDGVDVQEFRTQKVTISEHTAVVLTSKVAVDHFFRMAKEVRFDVPDTMKYFCISEQIAYYLQKYVTYRKRKIFFGKQTMEDLAEVMKKHKNEKFLLPCTDLAHDNASLVLTKHKFGYSKAVLYRTVASDLSDLKDIFYDMLVFFTPTGIESLFKNFPDFKQNDTLIAVFGPTTAKTAKEHNLRIDINVPQPGIPSMPAAIEAYIKNEGKKK